MSRRIAAIVLAAVLVGCTPCSTQVINSSTSYPGIDPQFGADPDKIDTPQVVEMGKEKPKIPTEVVQVDPTNTEYAPVHVTGPGFLKCRRGFYEAKRWYKALHLEGLDVRFTCGLPDSLIKISEEGHYFYYGATEFNRTQRTITVWVNPEDHPDHQKQPEEVVIHEFIHIFLFVGAAAQVSGESEIEEYLVRNMTPFLYASRRLAK